MVGHGLFPQITSRAVVDLQALAGAWQGAIAINDWKSLHSYYQKADATPTQTLRSYSVADLVQIKLLQASKERASSELIAYLKELRSNYDLEKQSLERNQQLGSRLRPLIGQLTGGIGLARKSGFENITKTLNLDIKKPFA